MHIFQRCRNRQTDLVIRPSKSIVQEPIFQIGGGICDMHPNLFMSNLVVEFFKVSALIVFLSEFYIN